jgi:hypothetical protein
MDWLGLLLLLAGTLGTLLIGVLIQVFFAGPGAPDLPAGPPGPADESTAAWLAAAADAGQELALADYWKASTGEPPLTSRPRSGEDAPSA